MKMHRRSPKRGTPRSPGNRKEEWRRREEEGVMVDGYQLEGSGEGREKRPGGIVSENQIKYLARHKRTNDPQ